LYLFSQIHEIVFHGKGGYDWATVYNMPVWLRRFTFEKIKEFYEKEREAMDKQQNVLTNDSVKDVNRPNITPSSNNKQPTYVTKAPKK
jgi:hypothetical protein